MQGRCSSARSEWLKLLSHLSNIIDVYDRMNRVMSLGIDVKTRREFLDRVEELCGKPRVVLDVGCGPGTLASLIAEKWNPYIVALDPIPEMLDALGSRCKSPLVDRVVAVGEHLPLRDDTVDLATAAFSLRDFIDWKRGIDEMIRVSRFCAAVLDIARAENPLLLVAELAWWGFFVPLAALLLARKNPTRYAAIARTILRWAPPSIIARHAERNGRVVVERLAFGFAFRLIVSKYREAGHSGERCKRSEICIEAGRSAEQEAAARSRLYEGS